MSGQVTHGTLLLLDTNALVHLARQDATGRGLEAAFGLAQRPERPLLSSTVEGEARYLAAYWGWGEQRQRALQHLFDGMVRVSAGVPDVVRAYAVVHAAQTRAGARLGENDTWIAASAIAAGAALLTLDSDFDRLLVGPITLLRFDTDTQAVLRRRVP